MSGLRVGIVGCGLIGRKRAEALGADELVGCYDVVPEAARGARGGARRRACADLDELLALGPGRGHRRDHPRRARRARDAALAAGAHVLVEKPARDRARRHRPLAAAAAARRAGWSRWASTTASTPRIARAVAEVRSGRHGELMFMRGRYGHGGRLGYDREWRADPARSGGGELIDQGMHLLDLTHWLLGPLPLHSALLRTSFWDTPVEDNAALLLGERAPPAPWAMLHVTWTEWKNLFSLEIYCRTASSQVDGLVRSYGPQRLRIYRMRPELGPPDLEEVATAARTARGRRSGSTCATRSCRRDAAA